MNNTTTLINKITFYTTSNPKTEKNPSAGQVGSFRDDKSQKWYAIYLFDTNNKPNELCRSVYLYQIMDILTCKEISNLVPDELQIIMEIEGAKKAKRKFLSDPKLETNEQVKADIEFLMNMVGQKTEDPEDEIKEIEKLIKDLLNA